MPQKKRDSSFELLRVLCMYIVIAAHVTPHTLSPLYWNSVFSYGTAGLFFADLYFMISGYFMIAKPAPSYKKIYSLFITIYLCAIFSAIAFVIFGITGIYSFKSYSMNNYMGLFVHYFTSPITSNVFWFITAYVILFFLTPILNNVINNLNKKGHLAFLLIMLTIYSFSNGFNFKYAQIVRAVFDYALGGYFMLYAKKSENKVRHNAIFIPLAVLLIIFTAIVNVHYDNSDSSSFIVHLAEKTFLNGILFNLCAITIFSIFHNLSFSNSFINGLSKTTFAVYLLHANEMTAQVWKIILPQADITSTNFIPVAIFRTVAIFIICALFDWLIIEKITVAIRPFTDRFYDFAVAHLTKQKEKGLKNE